MCNIDHHFSSSCNNLFITSFLIPKSIPNVENFCQKHLTSGNNFCFCLILLQNQLALKLKSIEQQTLIFHLWFCKMTDSVHLGWVPLGFVTSHKLSPGLLQVFFHCFFWTSCYLRHSLFMTKDRHAKDQPQPCKHISGFCLHRVLGM